MKLTEAPAALRSLTEAPTAALRSLSETPNAVLRSMVEAAVAREKKLAKKRLRRRIGKIALHGVIGAAAFGVGFVLGTQSKIALVDAVRKGVKSVAESIKAKIAEQPEEIETEEIEV